MAQNELKILMMGGRRVGKTSILASMYNNMQHSSVVNKYLKIFSDKILEMKGTEKQDALDTVYNGLSNYVRDRQGKTFIIDNGKTQYAWDYYFDLKLDYNDPNSMRIHFLDVPGEWFTDGPSADERTKFDEFVKECDVYVIAVDTPFLMETEYNALGTIHEVLASNQIFGILGNMYQNNDELNKKMIVFVPVKCEKWIKENKLSEVSKRIKEEYQLLIENADKKRTQIAIIPLQTAGNIFFSSMTEPKTVVIPPDEGGDPILTRIRKQGRDFLREDGTPYEVTGLENKDDITPQNDGRNDLGGGMLRPYCWFNVEPDARDACPQNCEQLPLHILSFWLKKYYEVLNEARKKKGPLIVIWERILKFLGLSFGTIDPENLNDRVGTLEKNGAIKGEEIGIEYINKVL